MSEIHKTKNTDNNIIKNLSHFNNLLNVKLNNKEELHNKNLENDNNKGYEINDNSDIFLEEYNSNRMLQYSHLYFLRLQLVKPKLIQLAKHKWKNVRICENILETKHKVNINLILKYN